MGDSLANANHQQYNLGGGNYGGVDPNPPAVPPAWDGNEGTVNGTEAVAGSADLSVYVTGTLPIDYTLESGTLTGWQTLNINGILSWTTGATISTTPITVRATNTDGFDVSLTITISITAAASLPAPQYFDDMESADFANPVGWSYNSHRAVSIVKDQYVVANDSGPIVPPTGPIAGRDWDAQSGIHAMRFRFAQNTSAFSEVRLNLDEEYSEFWIRYWLKVPINFEHDPTASGGSDNNKLIMCWHDAYSTAGDGSTCGIEFRPDNGGAGMGSEFYCKVSAGRNSSLGSDQGKTAFISSPADQGRWMQIAIRLKDESSVDAGDGDMEVWRRWSNEPSFTKTHSLLGNQPIRKATSGAGSTGFTNLYLMGADNSHYNSDTEFLIDDFSISHTALVPPGDL